MRSTSLLPVSWATLVRRMLSPRKKENGGRLGRPPRLEGAQSKRAELQLAAVHQLLRVRSAGETLVEATGCLKTTGLKDGNVETPQRSTAHSHCLGPPVQPLLLADVAGRTRQPLPWKERGHTSCWRQLQPADKCFLQCRLRHCGGCCGVLR